MTRTFLAIELPDDVRAALRSELARLRRLLPAIHWAGADSLHLTLAFLGELADEQLAAATDAAAQVAPAHRPIRLEIAGRGTFGSPWAPRVVWAGIGGQTQQLAALHAALAGALTARGFALDSRPFAPHLTLARIKDRLDDATLATLHADLQARAGVVLGAWEADYIAVMKSELLRPAARYTCLRTLPLG
jgi:2'-5' RNA ligase